MHAEVMIFTSISNILSRKLKNKQKKWMLKRKTSAALWTFFGLVTKVSWTIYPHRVTEVARLRQKRYDTILIIIIVLSAQSWKRTFSSLKNNRSLQLWLWRSHFLFDSEDAFLVKLKVVLDSAEVMTKLLVAVLFTAENKSAASHFHHAMKTESTKICSD